MYTVISDPDSGAPQRGRERYAEKNAITTPPLASRDTNSKKGYYVVVFDRVSYTHSTRNLPPRKHEKKGVRRIGYMNIQSPPRCPNLGRESAFNQSVNHPTAPASPPSPPDSAARPPSSAPPPPPPRPRRPHPHPPVPGSPGSASPAAG